ncbi:TRAP transporter substrate-binding protein [Ponticaulis sp.]|uniref:TRAP transporter substrate-binding protein n=1 Tax=Ponticaulis sp. TaxID=2020902 RepID=UPI000B64E60B|nr:TRAP transporter substrate-binding protein [Ponticaulis sp.]MAJ09253.1 C4-dicarboxylate ABC transporter [Ponticaulis sp.]HBH89624.1 C4-dicarboxylate ABC transporter [Hyphomonadaceae bacterium]|tara:strand:- start:4243 stop:5265 length:1023 start_codon:yes stop_codon:yes gene_type:complete
MTQTPSLNRRRVLQAGAAGLAGMSLGACGQAGSRPLLSSDTHPSDYPTVQAVRHMGEVLREQTDGRLDIRIYAGGQLGSERDTLEITSFGGLDMNRVNLAPLNSIEPMTVIPSLPFLFSSTEHMRQSLDGAPGDVILNSLVPHNLVGLCFYDSGERSFYNTRQAIRTPDDMRGMKIRVQNSDLYVAMIRALGADATPMPLGEVYQSLVQGVIDGAENNWPSYESGRHFEAAPYYSLTRHVMAPEILVMSLSRWRKLSEADQELVVNAAKSSVPFMRELWDARVAGARERLMEAGIQANEVDNLSDFQGLMEPVWENFIVTPEQEELVNQIQSIGSELGGA